MKFSRFSARKMVRTFHRDIGYLIIGLTFVYAISGIAVNHIKDWNPNYAVYEKQFSLPLSLKNENEAIKKWLHQERNFPARPNDFFQISANEYQVSYDLKTITINFKERLVIEEGEESRFLLKALNWLHLNRNKESWTIIADFYAIMLLILAFSGLFMFPVKRLIKGRGIVLVSVGFIVPFGYVYLMS
ncbi:MAG: hypothetical protein HN826_09820 [Methylococcales bacterium]|nr:hypothetical protein [Methylococcales bacterium]